MGYDPKQGHEIHDLLEIHGCENTGSSDLDAQGNLIRVENCFYDLMEKGLHLNMEDESLKDTPTRVAKMFCQEIFYGLDYNKWPSCSTFKSDSDEMVAVRKIAVKSMCEHHFMPFVGHATVAYIPNGRVIGISKLNRIVDFFSRRPQMQERLTEQVALAVGCVLQTADVAVAIKAAHYCTRMRGVKDEKSETVTSKLLGRFKTVPELRQEWIGLTR